jgi:hypothetical protein
MGTDIDNEEFDDRDYSRFADRLGECLSALGQLLEQPGFGTGPATIGADLELFLIDSAARPLPRNRAVCAATADPRVNVEPNRCNPGTQRHASLAGRAAIRPLRERLNPDCRPGGRRGQGPRGPGRGHRHLPTLSPADLGPAMMTDVPRYRALSGGLRRLRQDRFRIRIASADPLELADDVGLEAATTSFQVHLRVDPADFTRTHNAVQLATAPVMAVSGNSPTFLSHRLWEETRIAVFRQSIDDRSGRGPRRRTGRTGWGRAFADRDAGPACRPHHDRHAGQRRIPDRAVALADGPRPTRCRSTAPTMGSTAPPSTACPPG